MADQHVRVYLSEGDQDQLSQIETDDYVEFVGTINGAEIPVRFYRADSDDPDQGKMTEPTPIDAMLNLIRKLEAAATGDSNDKEIELYREALDLALTRWADLPAIGEYIEIDRDTEVYAYDAIVKRWDEGVEVCNLDRGEGFATVKADGSPDNVYRMVARYGIPGSDECHVYVTAWDGPGIDA